MRKKKSAEVSIDTSCPLPTFEDYHRFTMLDTQNKYKGHEGYIVRNWFPASTMNLVVDKLGQLEDIEDELGIDLITLFKLINAKNIYSYGHTSVMKNTGQVDIYDKTITIWNGTCHQVYPLSEYGKSFALTKEELL